jgi:hypothetical protein
VNSVTEIKKKKRWTPKKESEMRWIQKWMLYHSIRVCWWATNEALSFQEGIRKRESWSVTSPLWPANLWQGQAAYGWFWDRRVPLSPLWKTPSRKPCIAFHSARGDAQLSLTQGVLTVIYYGPTPLLLQITLVSFTQGFLSRGWNSNAVMLKLVFKYSQTFF